MRKNKLQDGKLEVYQERLQEVYDVLHEKDNPMRTVQELLGECDSLQPRFLTAMQDCKMIIKKCNGEYKWSINWMPSIFAAEKVAKAYYKRGNLGT